MAIPIIVKKMIEAAIDAESLGVVVNGDESTDVVTRLGAKYPTIKKAIRTMFETGGLPASPFATKANMETDGTSLPDGQLAMVHNETANNGLYVKVAGAWVKSEYDPLGQQKQYVDSNPLFKPQRLEPTSSIDDLFTAGIYHVPLDSTAIALGLPTGRYGQIYVSGNTKSNNTGSVFHTYINADGSVYQNIYDTRWLGWKGSDARELVKIAGVFANDNSNLLFAVTDQIGNLTDLQIDSSGSVPQSVLNDWARRLNLSGTDDILSSAKDYADDKDAVVLSESKEYTNMVAGNVEKSHITSPAKMPEIPVTLTSLHTSDTYFHNGELLPIMPNLNRAIFIGSSSASASATYFRAELAAIKPSIQIYTPCFGGAVMTQMQAMVGDKPLSLSFTGNKINKTGDTAVTVPSGFIYDPRTNNMSGWAQGVLGNLKSVGGVVSFTRRNPAAADTPVPNNVDFIPEFGHLYRSALQVIWIGKNNLNSSDADVNDVEKLIADTNSMIDFNSSFIKRTVIMTHFVNRDIAADDPIRARINYCNHLYKLRYKSNVFDVEPILLGTQIFTDLGITRTSSDIMQQEMGNLPPSLSTDKAHCTPAVYQYIMQKLGVFIASKNYLGV